MIMALLLPKLYNNKKIFFFIVFASMGALSGLRSPEVGIDTSMYHYLYYWTNGHDIEWEYFDKGYYLEIGARILMVISYYIFDDSQGYIFLSSVLTYIFMGLFCYRCIKNKYYWLAPIILIGFGFYSYSLCVLRQALAISIACNALPYICNRQHFKGMSVILFASLFHFGVVILLPICFFIKITCNNTRYEQCKKMFFIIIFLGGSFFILFPFIQDYLSEKYLLYLTDKNEPVVTYYMIITLIVYAFLLYKGMRIREVNRSKEENLMITYSCLFIMCSILVGLVSFKIDIFNRFINVFDIYICILIPMLIDNYSGKNKFFIKCCLLLYCFAEILYLILGDRWGTGNYEFF